MASFNQARQTEKNIYEENNQHHLYTFVILKVSKHTTAQHGISGFNHNTSHAFLLFSSLFNISSIESIHVFSIKHNKVLLKEDKD